MTTSVRAWARRSGPVLALVVTMSAGACAPLPAPPPARAAAGQRAGGGPSAARDDLLGFVPDTAQALLSVDVALLRRSAWARPVLAWAAEREGGGGQGGGARGGRGFDEVADADRWLFARVGASMADAGTLELARGRFEAPRVLDAFARRRPEARATGAGPAGMADPEQAVAVLDPRTIAFGTPGAVAAAAQAARAQAAPEARLPWLAELAAALDDELGPRGAGLAVELLVRLDEGARRELAALLEGDFDLRQLGGRMALGGTARVSLVGLTPGREQARALAAALGGRLHALAERRSVRALALAPPLRRALITARGARVVFEMQMTDAERELVAERLAALAELLAKSPEPPP
jgi:hypothetical protein